MNALFRGVWASVMATSTMTMTMFEAHRLLPEDEQKPLPPAELTKDVLKKTHLQPAVSSEIQDELTMLSHYGYGAAAGVLYSMTASRSSASPLAKGLLFGLAVYGASYYGLIPGLNLQPKGKNMPPARNGMMMAAHLVWGASLAFAENKLKERGDRMLDGRKEVPKARHLPVENSARFF